MAVATVMAHSPKIKEAIITARQGNNSMNWGKCNKIFPLLAAEYDYELGKR